LYHPINAGCTSFDPCLGQLLLFLEQMLKQGYSTVFFFVVKRVMIEPEYKQLLTVNTAYGDSYVSYLMD
jgi:hypothetical protein